MAAQKRRSRHTVRNILLIVLLVCILAAVALYFLLSSKVKKLQQGAAFDFSYTVTSTAAEEPTLYAVLKSAKATQGDVYGVYAPGKLLLSFYQLNGTEATAIWDAASGEMTLHPEAKASEPFTRVYVDSTETLYDVGQLYNTARKAIVNAYPIASSLLPEWSLGNYISQTQIATLLGVEASTVEMQDMTNFTLALTALRSVTPTGALEGFSYFQLTMPDATLDSPVLIFGVPKTALFSSTIPVHVLLTIPQHSVKVELLGTLNAADSTIIAPTSRMKDEDIAVFAQIRQTVEQLLKFAQQAAGTASSSNG